MAYSPCALSARSVSYTIVRFLRVFSPSIRYHADHGKGSTRNIFGYFGKFAARATLEEASVRAAIFIVDDDIIDFYRPLVDFHSIYFIGVSATRLN